MQHISYHHIQEDFNSWLIIVVFGVIWLNMVLMKTLRPNEFLEIFRRPFIYYRLYSSKARRYFEDFKVLGFLNAVLLFFLFLTYLFKVTEIKQTILIFIIVLSFSLYSFIVFKIFNFFNPNYSHLHLIKWIYTNHATFIGSFILFIVIFLSINHNVKVIFLIISFLQFHFLYLKALLKLKHELRIKTYYIIFYLCTTEIAPLAVIIFYLINKL